jgi:death-on-curing protein
MSFDYIRVDDILTIHADQIERYGGGEGIRDSSLVEAALWWKSFPE